MSDCSMKKRPSKKIRRYINRYYRRGCKVKGYGLIPFMERFGSYVKELRPSDNKANEFTEFIKSVWSDCPKRGQVMYVFDRQQRSWFEWEHNGDNWVRGDVRLIV